MGKTAVLVNFSHSFPFWLNYKYFEGTDKVTKSFWPQFPHVKNEKDQIDLQPTNGTLMRTKLDSSHLTLHRGKWKIEFFQPMTEE